MWAGATLGSKMRSDEKGETLSVPGKAVIMLALSPASLHLTVSLVCLSQTNNIKIKIYWVWISDPTAGPRVQTKEMVRSYLHPWSNAQSDRWWSAPGSWNNPHRMSSPTSLRSCRGGRKEGERKKDHPGCNSPNHRKTKHSANLQQQETKLSPLAWPSPRHPRPASHTAAMSSKWGRPSAQRCVDNPHGSTLP